MNTHKILKPGAQYDISRSIFVNSLNRYVSVRRLVGSRCVRLALDQIWTCLNANVLVMRH